MVDDLEYTKEYCSVCKVEHTMLDGGDIIDCMIYYRNNVESEDVKKAREDKVEIWEPIKKVWVKKSKYRRTG